MSLVDLGLLKKGNKTGRHPVYRVNVASRKFAALSLLAYAVLDDRDGTDCMAEAVHDYYSKVVREKYEPMAIATTAYYSPRFSSWNARWHNQDRAGNVFRECVRWPKRAKEPEKTSRL